MKDFTEVKWKALSGVLRLLKRMPLTWSVRFGASLGWLLWALDKKKVDEAERRCVRALQVGPTIARGIVRRSYMNLGRSVAEFVSAPGSGRSMRSIVHVHGEEHLREALDSGNGVIFFSGHIGNWEFGAAVLAEMGYPMNAIGADQRDERVTDLIIGLRAVSGVTTVSKGFDLKAAIRCLKRGEALAILIDQDVRERGVVVPFLGIPASTPYGPAKIAGKIGSVILPSFMLRRGTSEEHDLHILPSPWKNGRPEPDESMEEAMARCNDLISEYIRRAPDQWMWLYPRWASTGE